MNIEDGKEVSSEVKLRNFYKEGKLLLCAGDLAKAYKYFVFCNNIWGQAYCKFLSRELKESFNILQSVVDSSPVVNWELCLLGILLDKKNYEPTYFQIRNFFETDIDMLFKYSHTDYVKKIFMELGYFLKFNREIFKYAARTLINNGGEKEAIFFLNRSLDINYRDPEVHFMLGEIYLNHSDRKNAIMEYRKSNEVIGEYMPAIEKLKELGEKI